MSTKPTGGPAFPRPSTAYNREVLSEEQSGMDLRDYFAAKAMQGQMANGEILKQHGLVAQDVAKFSYELADALIAERDK